MEWPLPEQYWNTVPVRKSWEQKYFLLHIIMNLLPWREKFLGLKNYNIAVKKRGEDVIFLRKIVPGAADDSFGIEVARLAGIPDKVVSRALSDFEGTGERQFQYGAGRPGPIPRGPDELPGRRRQPDRTEASGYHD